MTIPYPWRSRCCGWPPAPRRSRLCIANYASPCCATWSASDFPSDEAQDVVQDAFLSLQRHLASDGKQGNIRGWLFRVAHNQARNRQTSYYRRFSEPLDGEMDFLADDATPEQRVLEKEKFRRLAAAIRLLTESERECLLLRAGGLRYREIGEVLGMAVSTVGDTVERAIKKLAEKCNV